MFSSMLVTGLVFIFVAYLNVLRSVDACAPPLPTHECQNVSCPYGDTCRSYGAWCQSQSGNLDACYPPLAVCGDTMDPCTVALCPKGTVCLSVKDQCSNNGACTVKPQCVALSRPGTCPPPIEVSVGMCVISCQNDARCPSGTKCCPGLTNSGTANFCFQPSAGL